MKKENRFIITEIHKDDLHAVNKVLVDRQTRVQYLLHQEGATMTCVTLVDENGKPLLSDDLTPYIPPKTDKIVEKDTINERKYDEILETFKPVEIKK